MFGVYFRMHFACPEGERVEDVIARPTGRKCSLMITMHIKRGHDHWPSQALPILADFTIFHSQLDSFVPYCGELEDARGDNEDTPRRSTFIYRPFSLPNNTHLCTLHVCTYYNVKHCVTNLRLKLQYWRCWIPESIRLSRPFIMFRSRSMGFVNGLNFQVINWFSIVYDAMR